jgi:hypothetical protein
MQDNNGTDDISIGSMGVPRPRLRGASEYARAKIEGIMGRGNEDRLRESTGEHLPTAMNDCGCRNQMAAAPGIDCPPTQYRMVSEIDDICNKLIPGDSAVDRSDP